LIENNKENEYDEFFKKFKAILDGKYEKKGIPKYTQTELANLSGVSKQKISVYYNGTNKPSVEKLIKLSKGLNCSVDFLIRKDVIEPNPRNQNILNNTGLSSECLKRLVHYRNKNEKIYNKIMTTLELLISNIGLPNTDVLYYIARYLTFEADDSLYIINDTAYECFTDILNSEEDSEKIREAFNKYFSTTFDVDINKTHALSNINKSNVYLDTIKGALQVLSRDINNKHYADDYENEPVGTWDVDINALEDVDFSKVADILDSNYKLFQSDTPSENKKEETE
jgi:transcriptional regulator with XRE-family HTH domain